VAYEEDRFGPYIVHECIGTGGMAIVHHATLELEDGDTCEVALKRLLPQIADDRRLVDDFVREAKLASQLVHPNIARILEAGRIGKTYFIAMELVRGSSLVALLRRVYLAKRSPPIGVVLSLMIDACEALDHAHDRQVVHRDFSPSNLLVTEDGHLVVIDFGVAKALAGQLQTNSGLAKGKLGYMSVEAIGGKHLDARADIFSAGVVLWELIAGRRLFRGANEYEVILKIQKGQPARPSRYNAACPHELDDIIMRALARDPDDRWPSAAALRRELAELRHTYGDAATPEAVARWVDALCSQGPSVEEETTEMHLTGDDLEEVMLAEGSRRAEPYDIEPPLVAAPRPEPARPRFLDPDTVITDAERDDRES
jgi:serine/threonine protein kinase